jgi:hypothetical protein
MQSFDDKVAGAVGTAPVALMYLRFGYGGPLPWVTEGIFIEVITAANVEQVIGAGRGGREPGFSVLGTGGRATYALYQFVAEGSDGLFSNQTSSLRLFYRRLGSAHRNG